MGNDTAISVFACFLVMLLVTVLTYGSYRLGRITERKALTASLVTAIQETYWDGYTDALTGMKK